MLRVGGCEKKQSARVHAAPNRHGLDPEWLGSAASIESVGGATAAAAVVAVGAVDTVEAALNDTGAAERA